MSGMGVEEDWQLPALFKKQLEIGQFEGSLLLKTESGVY
jgi:hypothetical protein